MSEHVKTVNYIVDKAGSNYYAKDKYGRLKYTGTIISAILNQCFTEYGFVYVKAGIHTITTSITITDNDYGGLVGEGRGTQFIAKNTLDSDIISIDSSDYFELRDFKISGNKANNSSGKGIYIYESQRPILDNLQIKETKSHGVHIAGTSGTYSLQPFIRNCHIENSDDTGLNIDTYSTDALITHCDIGASKNQNVVINSSAFLMSNCAIWGSTASSGVYIGGVGSGVFVGNRIDYNLYYGVALDGSQNITFTGNELYYNSQGSSGGYSALIIINGTFNTVVGNRIGYHTLETQKYGVEENGTSDYNLIKANVFNGNVTGGVLKLGTNTKVSENLGHITEAFGRATLASGSTINTGLVSTPLSAIITPVGTSFLTGWNTVNTSGSIIVYHGGGGSNTISWYASV